MTPTALGIARPGDRIVAQVDSGFHVILGALDRRFVMLFEPERADYALDVDFVRTSKGPRKACRQSRFGVRQRERAPSGAIEEYHDNRPLSAC